MNLLSLCQADTELKKVATTKGGEYAGACPWCGGTDRFRVWPEQGRYWCRRCGKGGDDVQYLRDKREMSFQDAWKTAGRGALPDKSTTGLHARVRHQAAEGSFRSGSGPKPDTWKPQALSLPGEQWQDQAGKLVDYASGKLFQSAVAWGFLNGRGLNDETIEGWKLGIWPEDRYIKREPWGLPVELTQQGKKKDLWIPAGIVIPHLINGEVARLRIRRNEGEPRYYNVSGSYMGPMVLGPDRDVFIVVESELDGLLLWQDCGDMAGVIALGNAQTRPDRGAAFTISKSRLILVALDADQAGAKASWQWWIKTFTQARRWPSVSGKDPGEMWQAGIDLKTWATAGFNEYLKS